LYRLIAVYTFFSWSFKTTPSGADNRNLAQSKLRFSGTSWSIQVPFRGVRTAMAGSLRKGTEVMRERMAVREAARAG
jgi:hypothetical protein